MVDMVKTTIRKLKLKSKMLTWSYGRIYLKFGFITYNVKYGLSEIGSLLNFGKTNGLLIAHYWIKP